MPPQSMSLLRRRGLGSLKVCRRAPKGVRGSALAATWSRRVEVAKFLYRRNVALQDLQYALYLTGLTVEGAMSRKKTKRTLTAKKTASLMTGVIWEFLEKLPRKERQKRLADAHKSIKARLAIEKRVASGTGRKGAGRSISVPTPYAARGGR